MDLGYIKLFVKIANGMINTLLVLLQQHSASPALTGIHLQLEQAHKARSHEDRCTAEESFTRLKSMLTSRGPGKKLLHTSQASEGSNHISKIFTKPTIAVSHPQETAKLTPGLQYRIS